MTVQKTGAWPVAPTPFNDDGTLDLDGMKRVLDCIIDQGADGVCILANYSEQFLISDEERAILTRLSLEHVAGRIPVMVTVSHFATPIVVERARFAKDCGAASVMIMAPYHGALMRGTPEQTFEQFRKVGEVGIPIVVQDAPLSGVELPVSLLVKMAREIEMVQHFKIECTGAATKLRALIAEGGDAVVSPLDGEEGVTMLADLDAGAVGTMCSAMITEHIRGVVQAHREGDRERAVAGYARILPAVQHENRQCGFRAAKAAMVEGKVFASEFCRHPIAPLGTETRNELLGLLRPLDPIAMRWGH
ncbi:dihydrodipicolinate synthase family protein [Celeribacter halophilus]|uniref:4-hydroxy-tetrahydrodipicolinate synthase n=1 Tax=Celeribacter halophilus TaxID=576117 RepID=A0A1I3WUL0_9RHOB|nr:dihydrodipicolinate synthase family protein [Celeribacter halophilus]MDO6724777.1 dihydrodipicolinate synthase family protein [Celeribacter halophilus]PZX05546.1 4-hydroxy-tetrahydrodipicolinate synthase [Celeribacter halophilus]SFK11324.1 4-hydroxy-tetrahydrodipicolinate synthase [Celeribacter halophilus]